GDDGGGDRGRGDASRTRRPHAASGRVRHRGGAGVGGGAGPRLSLAGQTEPLKIPVARIPLPWNVSFPQENLPETLRRVERTILILHSPREEMNDSARRAWITIDRTSCEDVRAGRPGVVPWMIRPFAARF